MIIHHLHELFNITNMTIFISYELIFRTYRTFSLIYLFSYLLSHFQLHNFIQNSNNCFYIIITCQNKINAYLVFKTLIYNKVLFNKEVRFIYILITHSLMYIINQKSFSHIIDCIEIQCHRSTADLVLLSRNKR